MLIVYVLFYLLYNFLLFSQFGCVRNMYNNISFYI